MPKAKPKKKTTRPKRRRSRKKPFIKRDLILPVAAAVAAVLAAVVFFLSAPEEKTVVNRASRKTTAVNKPTHTPPPGPTPAPVEHPPKAVEPAPVAKPHTTQIPTQGQPRVAIVIDDMGQDPAHLEALMELGAPLSVAILPYQPYAEQTADRARSAGLDVLLHMPMEADSKYTGLGEGALYVGMNEEEIAAALDEAFLRVPGAVGINNHMGSAFTADRTGMESVMRILRRRGLFFLDSRTTSDTVAEITARELGVPTAARKVFLDDSNEPEDVREQFERLEALAKKNGEAIAIGHPRPATLQVLREGLPELEEEGIALVRVSSLVR